MEQNRMCESNHVNGVFDDVLEACVVVTFGNIPLGVFQTQKDKRQRDMLLQHFHGFDTAILKALKDDIDQIDATAGLKDVDQSLEAYVHHVLCLS